MSHNLNPSNHTASPDRYLMLRSYARCHRYEPTIAELRLWECLKGKRLGVKFRRQHIIQDFIVDFVCLDEMLVIEVDGEYHQTPEQQTDDQKRTEILQQLNYRVLRFSNDEVLYNIDEVIEEIKKHFIFTI